MHLQNKYVYINPTKGEERKTLCLSNLKLNFSIVQEIQWRLRGGAVVVILVIYILWGIHILGCAISVTSSFACPRLLRKIVSLGTAPWYRCLYLTGVGSCVLAEDSCVNGNGKVVSWDINYTRLGNM